MVSAALRALMALWALQVSTVAAEQPVAIILDDLGEQYQAGELALTLPSEVALAYLPGTRFGAEQSARAAARGHEVLLHMPMEPFDQRITDARALRVGMPGHTITQRLHAALAELPHAVGVNNHQGSRFTANARAIDAFMRALAAHRGLYFIDSRTSAVTRAHAAAGAHGIPTARRHVFIDAERGEAAVAEGWNELQRHAQRFGSAIAIAHPYPETLALLADRLPRMAEQGLRLVPPSALLQPVIPPATAALSGRATTASHRAAPAAAR